MAKERALSINISHTSDELEKKSRPLAQRKFVVWELLAQEGLAVHGRTDLTFVNDPKNNRHAYRRKMSWSHIEMRLGRRISCDKYLIISW
jgi:hypothetical protein